MSEEERRKKEQELEEVKSELKEAEANEELYNAMQLSLKAVINGAYGAFANVGFSCSNGDIANSITAMGRDMIQFVARRHEHFWKEEWHNREDLHQLLGINNVEKIPDNEEVVVYGDTDSVSGDTQIRLKKGSLEIKKLFNQELKKSKQLTKTNNGHEMVQCSKKVLVWNEEEGPTYKHPEYIIRHKVRKPKWKLKTDSGKEIFVTGDHSLVVYRDDELHVIQAKQIKEGDKVVSLTKEKD